MTTDELEQLYKHWSDIWDECSQLEQTNDPRLEQAKQEQYSAWRLYYTAYLSRNKRHQQPEVNHE